MRVDMNEIKLPEEVKATEEEKVSDPTVHQIDLRLTKVEWMIYWKMKFESSLAKIIEAQRVVESAKKVVAALKNENNMLKAELASLKSTDMISVKKPAKRRKS
jgi:cell division protein FtsB